MYLYSDFCGSWEFFYKSSFKLNYKHNNQLSLFGQITIFELLFISKVIAGALRFCRRLGLSGSMPMLKALAPSNWTSNFKFIPSLAV
jgi:hypothetical protein